jgi:hypothetical protein
MMQKRLYIGHFNRNGQLVDVTFYKAMPHKNKQLIPNFARRISKTEYEHFRLVKH